MPTSSGLHQFINFWSHSLSRIARAFSAPNQNFALPVHSSYHVVASQMSRCPFSKHFFDKYFGPVHCPCNFKYLLPLLDVIHRYLMASAHHSVRCFVSSPSLIHEYPFFFWLRLELFTIFPFLHQAVKACRTLQGCIHFFFSLSCCTVFALTSAINPSSNTAPAFANSSALSLPSATNFSNCDTSFLSFLCGAP